MDAAWLKTGGIRGLDNDLRRRISVCSGPPTGFRLRRNELAGRGDICCMSAVPGKRCGEDLLSRRRQRMTMQGMAPEEEGCVSNHPFRDYLRP